VGIMSADPMVNWKLKKTSCLHEIIRL